MDTQLPDLSSLRPAGGKRSTKRDRILEYLSRQKGHVSADDLFDLVRREDAGIGRATVYRTLQWMVDAGIARKVDFGEGRSRFEPSYRHPRHFHSDLHQLPSLVGVPQLRRRVADGRNRHRAQLQPGAVGRPDLRHLRGVPTGKKTLPIDGATTELVFARDALRMAIATERSGLEFYTRAASLTKDARGRTVFQKLAGEEERAPRHAAEALSRARRQGSAARVAADVPVLQGRGERPVRRRRRAAARGRQRSAGAAHRHQVRARLAQVLQALRRALRGLRRQADLPRVRRRGARASRPADSRVPGAAGAAEPPRPDRARGRQVPVDRSSHPYDRVGRPLHARGARRRARPRPASPC